MAFCLINIYLYIKYVYVCLFVSMSDLNSETHGLIFLNFFGVTWENYRNVLSLVLRFSVEWVEKSYGEK